MSAIRPLATITILIGVGVLLWMRINETEPALPDGLGDFQVGSGLQFGAETSDFGGEFAATGAQDGSASLVGSQGATGATTAAPPFNSNSAALGGSSAPAWTPPPASMEPASDGNSVDDLPSVPATPELEMHAEGQSGDFVSNQPTNETSSVTADVVAPGPPAPVETVPSVETPPVADTSPAGLAPGKANESGDVVTPTPQTSLFAAMRMTVRSALDRGELSRALLLLSDWYDDPTLPESEKAEVDELLSQLAGTVIYSREPRLEPPYLVKAGETLTAIAAKFDVPAPLLAKINGVPADSPLTPGTELKVMHGPFSAVIDLSDRRLTLMLQRRYAGQFPIEYQADFSVEDGQWTVDQKPLAPTGGFGAGTDVQRSVVLANPSAPGGQVAVIRGPNSKDEVATGPLNRVIELKAGDIHDVFDILSVGSAVTIRR